MQEDFQQHGASLLKKLECYIASCDRIIALVGDAYCCEPDETARPAGQPRRSYTQWEYFFGMGARLDGSRQSSKDIFFYLASQEFLAMNAFAQPDCVAYLQQKFIEELCRSGQDRNQFGSLDQLRALVLRDGFRLKTATAPDLASAQPAPELATQQLTVREKSATEIIRNLRENTPAYRFHEKAEELYLRRGRESLAGGRQCTSCLINFPKDSGIAVSLR